MLTINIVFTILCLLSLSRNREAIQIGSQVYSVLDQTEGKRKA